MSISLEFKISGGFTLKLDIDSLNITVGELKQKCTESGDPNVPSSMRLIYKGRILKDDMTLEACGIQSGHVLHLVKGPGAVSTPPPVAETSTPTTVPQSAPLTPESSVNPPVPPPAPMPSFGGAPNMGGMPGMGAGMPGMGGLGGMDPNQMSQMMSNPAVQQMMGQMAQNPQLLASLMQNNPMVQQMAQQNPQMAQMLQNPQLMAALMNPAVINAMMGGNNQQGNPMGQANPAMPVPGVQNPTPAVPDQGTNPGAADPNQQNNAYAQMMAAMAANPALAQSLLNPAGQQQYVPAPIPQASLEELEAKYASQLQQLIELGFSDKNANLEALRVTDGNVEMAVNYLFDSGFGN